MLYRGNSEALQTTATRLLALAERGAGASEQRELIATLGASHRMAAVRPLVRAWACSAQTGRPRRRLFARATTASDDASETADAALQALSQLWSAATARQYSQLDQELRAGGVWSPVARGAWWQLSLAAALGGLPASGDLRTVGLGVLACHPSGHIREAAVRELVGAPLGASLPFVLIRANDWVRQVRVIAYARLLALDEADCESLAPLLELVEQLASQGRREPGAVDHLLNLLRTDRGLDAVRGCWAAEVASLRRAAGLVLLGRESRP